MMLKHKRYDVRVQRMNGYRLEIYWRADESGCGPCMSLYVGAREELRFDLFGNTAHMHIARQARQPRIFYPANQTRETYIGIAVSDMIGHYPQTARCAGWALEQLAKVTGPATPAVTARGRRSPARGRFPRR